jgi:hypothetical protein
MRVACRPHHDKVGNCCTNDSKALIPGCSLEPSCTLLADPRVSSPRFVPTAVFCALGIGPDGKCFQVRFDRAWIGWDSRLDGVR